MLKNVVSELEKNDYAKLINFEINGRMAKIETEFIPKKVAGTIDSYHKIGSEITLSYYGKLSTSGTSRHITPNVMHHTSKLAENHNVPIEHIFLCNETKDLYISGQPSGIYITGTENDLKIKGETLKKTVAPFIPKNKNNKFNCSNDNLTIFTKEKNTQFNGYNIAMGIANGLVDNNDFNITSLDNNYTKKIKYTGENSITKILHSPLKNLLEVHIDDILLDRKIKIESSASINFRKKTVSIKSPLGYLPEAISKISKIYHAQE